MSIPLIFVTKHGKELILRDLFRENKIELQVENRIDTDLFGTFTGTIKRIEDALTTARKKVEFAHSKFGHTWVLSSEGSFFPHPEIPFATVNLEIIFGTHFETNQSFWVSHASLETCSFRKKFSSPSELNSLLKSIDFPNQGIWIYQNHRVLAEISTWEEIDRFFSENWDEHALWEIESDQRAHRNPLRRKVILETGKKWLEALNSSCPKCSSAGFYPRKTQAGKPCAQCGFPTKSSKEKIYTCCHCDFEKTEPIDPENLFEDPMYCSLCNP